MNFQHYTIEWYKGEIFESTISGGFGLVIIITTLLLQLLETTDNAKALFWPLLLVGFILISAGIYNRQNNISILNEVKKTTINKEYIIKEKQRVENFQSLYTFTKTFSGVLFLTAILIFFLISNRFWLSIALSMVLLGLSGLVIDYFSKERADIYYERILEELGR
jgi:hypothetical protein